ncbi:hypothetical protein C8Q76DRAFT_475554 [Earliella scabrosa]|nr:hypothetical protein C8Q76DRAFT_475554 [Earliella scabrosa]
MLDFIVVDRRCCPFTHSPLTVVVCCTRAGSLGLIGVNRCCNSRLHESLLVTFSHVRFSRCLFTPSPFTSTTSTNSTTTPPSPPCRPPPIRHMIRPSPVRSRALWLACLASSIYILVLSSPPPRAGRPFPVAIVDVSHSRTRTRTRSHTLTRLTLTYSLTRISNHTYLHCNTSHHRIHDAPVCAGLANRIRYRPFSSPSSPLESSLDSSREIARVCAPSNSDATRPRRARECAGFSGPWATRRVSRFDRAHRTRARCRSRRVRDQTGEGVVVVPVRVQTQRAKNADPPPHDPCAFLCLSSRAWRLKARGNMYSCCLRPTVARTSMARYSRVGASPRPRGSGPTYWMPADSRNIVCSRRSVR